MEAVESGIFVTGRLFQKRNILLEGHVPLKMIIIS